MGGRRGITLIEMLVVIAIIALLLTLMLPVLVGARAQSRCVTCMSNVRQLTEAYFAYCANNEGKLFPCDNSVHQRGMPLEHQETDIAELTAYMGTASPFHCIEDTRQACRSYSINDYLGGRYPLKNFKHVRELKDVKNAARTFVFIEETPAGDKNGYTGGFVVAPPPLARWIDFPAILHPRGTCLSFADGHCEFWQWVDARTRALNQSPTLFPETLDNQDLFRLQGCMGQTSYQ
jgi:prepilin-type N-terminal cleavage/methylation domain-containing protein